MKAPNKLNCWPGARAVIVGEEPGCECNIGALVTVVKLDADYPDCWHFTDASRPLKMLDIDDSGHVSWINASDDPGIEFAWLADKYLVPIGEQREDSGDVVALQVDQPAQCGESA